MRNITLDEAGLIPTNINASYEDGEWWVRGNADGFRRRVNPHNLKNANRMFVDGSYVAQNHPLWKAGRYNSFNDAAFSSLQNYTKSSIGCVYIIKNPVWPEWVKVGKAVDAEDRLKGYQTGDPYRSYTLAHYIEVTDRHTVELKVHKELELASHERRNEWFKINLDGAIAVLNKQYTG